MSEEKKRIAKYDFKAMKKYRESKKDSTTKITIEGIDKVIAENFKNRAKKQGLSYRELFEKTFK